MGVCAVSVSVGKTVAVMVCVGVPVMVAVGVGGWTVADGWIVAVGDWVARGAAEEVAGLHPAHRQNRMIRMR